MSIMLPETFILQASLTTVVIYDHHIFIAQATGVNFIKLFFYAPVGEAK
jgi:hypothetical protein